MPSQIVVPELGESVVEATIASWLKQEGEQVSLGEPLVELETDKVDLEVGATQDGILVKIEVPAGEDVKVGDVLGKIEDLPKGGTVEQEEPEKTAEKPEIIEKLEPVEVESEEGLETGGEVAVKEISTPVARRMAEEQGVDLNELAAKNEGRRITKQDVQHYIQDQVSAHVEPEQAMPSATESRKSAGPASPQSIESAETRQVQDRNSRLEERVRMSRRRLTIATRLVEAQQSTAMLTTFNDVDMSGVMEIRRRRREEFRESHGVKLGIMSFFVKASIGGLKLFPRLNAEIQGEDFILKHYYDIGIAIGAEEGLVVPVLRDADRLSFAQIEKTILEYIEKTRDRALAIEDLRGGTFTITNGGVFGSLLSTPILNPPQSGILGLHRIEDRPVAVKGEVVIRPMMYLALSYDHRIVDGREAVQYLAKVKELIEDPEKLLLEG